MHEALVGFCIRREGYFKESLGLGMDSTLVEPLKCARYIRLKFRYAFFCIAKLVQLGYACVPGQSLWKLEIML